MTRVKICGVNDPVAFDTAIAAGADWIGFVFFARSPRVVTPARAASLAAVPLDILQLYTSPERAAAIGAGAGRAFWRAVPVSREADLPAAMDGAAALVIEGRAPPGATRPGGNASGFDWSLTRGWRAPGPWLLAGGLTPENVAAAIRQTGASAVDVSSGVEAAPGRKDPARIRAFIAAAKATTT